MKSSTSPEPIYIKMLRSLIIIGFSLGIAIPSLAREFWSLDRSEYVAYEMKEAVVDVDFWTERRAVTLEVPELANDGPAKLALENFRVEFIERLQAPVTTVHIRSIALRMMEKKSELGGRLSFGTYDSRYTDKIFPIVQYVDVEPVSLKNGTLALEIKFRIHLTYLGMSAQDYMNYSEMIYLNLTSGKIYAPRDVFATKNPNEVLDKIEGYANAEIEKFSTVLHYNHEKLIDIQDPKLTRFDSSALFYAFPKGDQLIIYILPHQRCTDSIYLSGLELVIPVDSFKGYFNQNGPYASLNDEKSTKSPLKNLNQPPLNFDIFNKLEYGDPALEAFYPSLATASVDSCHIYEVRPAGDSILRRVIIFNKGRFETVKWMSGTRLDNLAQYYYQNGRLEKVLTYSGHGPLKSQETYEYSNNDNLIRRELTYRNRIEVECFTYAGNTFALFTSPVFCTVRTENRDQNIFSIDANTFVDAQLDNPFHQNTAYLDRETGELKVGLSKYFNYNKEGMLTGHDGDYTVQYIYKDTLLTQISRYKPGGSESLTTIDYSEQELPVVIKVYNDHSTHKAIRYFR